MVEFDKGVIRCPHCGGLLAVVAANEITQSSRDAALARIAVLTGRELATLEKLARGISTKAAAAEFGISARTVEEHRRNIKRKLGAVNLSAVLRIAFVAGIGDLAG